MQSTDGQWDSTGASQAGGSMGSGQPGDWVQRLGDSAYSRGHTGIQWDQAGDPGFPYPLRPGTMWTHRRQSGEAARPGGQRWLLWMPKS